MKKLTLNVFVTQNNHDYENLFQNSEKLREQVAIQVLNVEDLHDTYEAYREGIQKSESEYVVFWTEKDRITVSVVEALMASLNGDPLYQLRLKKPDVDWAKAWPTILFCFSGYAFRTDTLRNMEVPKMISRLYQEYIQLNLAEKYGNPKELTNCVLETYEILENDRNIYEYCMDSTWYIDDYQELILPYLKTKSKSEVNKAVQRRIYAGIILRYFMNMNEKDKMAIQGEQIRTFFRMVHDILPYIDDDVIADRLSHRGVPVIITYLMYQNKHDNVLKHSVKKRRTELRHQVVYDYYVNDQFFYEDWVVLRIKAINYEHQALTFDCELRGEGFVRNPEESIHVLADGQKVSLENKEYYNSVKCFGHTLISPYQMAFSIPIEKIHSGMKIEFHVNLSDGTSIPLKTEYPLTASRLIDSKSSHFEFDQYLLMRDGYNLKIRKNTAIRHQCLEIGSMIHSMISPREMKRRLYYPYLRFLYWKNKKKYSQKKVWIFFDKLYKAGDNAEYMFEYCMKNAPEADCYYLITQESPDYNRLKKKYKDHILVYGSKHQRMVTLNASIIFATHAQVFRFCAFSGEMEQCFRDLLTAKVVCIQHGLTVQAIAQHQNLLVDNTRQYFCASKYEIQNLQQAEYGYADEQLYLTGSPRYDGLHSNDQKFILLTPTWRRNIVINGNSFGTAKEKNSEFKNTEYYKVYNNLIHNEKLINAATEYGYRIVFLLHPTISSQADDFEGGEKVEVIPATSGVSYEKMMTEASLMVTDYSGVQFDFAYMKKPVLYYHPEELPPQYEESVYKYETMAFGPLISKADHIVDALCEYMQKGCPMEQMYQDRVDDFFAHTDYDNCKRVLEVIRSSENKK